MMRVCQRQGRHLWESLRESLSVLPFTRAFLKSPSSRGLCHSWATCFCIFQSVSLKQFWPEAVSNTTIDSRGQQHKIKPWSKPITLTYYNQILHNLLLHYTASLCLSSSVSLLVNYDSGHGTQPMGQPCTGLKVCSAIGVEGYYGRLWFLFWFIFIISFSFPVIFLLLVSFSFSSFFRFSFATYFLVLVSFQFYSIGDFRKHVMMFITSHQHILHQHIGDCHTWQWHVVINYWSLLISTQ